jgi:hypothetical protein
MNISQKTSDIKDGWRYHISDSGNIDRRYKGAYFLYSYYNYIRYQYV